jgi:hypothetical protein
MLTDVPDVGVTSILIVIFAAVNLQILKTAIFSPETLRIIHFPLFIKCSIFLHFSDEEDGLQIWLVSGTILKKSVAGR